MPILLLVMDQGRYRINQGVAIVFVGRHRKLYHILRLFLDWKRIWYKYCE